MTRKEKNPPFMDTILKTWFCGWPMKSHTSSQGSTLREKWFSSTTKYFFNSWIAFYDIYLFRILDIIILSLYGHQGVFQYFENFYPLIRAVFKNHLYWVLCMHVDCTDDFKLAGTMKSPCPTIPRDTQPSKKEYCHGGADCRVQRHDNS